LPNGKSAAKPAENQSRVAKPATKKRVPLKVKKAMPFNHQNIENRLPFLELLIIVVNSL
jgi:hypothetical protein